MCEEKIEKTANMYNKGTFGGYTVAQECVCWSCERAGPLRLFRKKGKSSELQNGTEVVVNYVSCVGLCSLVCPVRVGMRAHAMWLLSKLKIRYRLHVT
jgi:hypothetical protein